ncbi:TPA: hypothetical protein HA249_05240 [Candidatus Woesearchaeota archaeon]|nr:hypothetical protein [Candidatus Woesearchaeota archaeon]HIH47341.1 hypothetical protein [Candidatus Woesearchaeota archaeon]HII87977.1 hypothetical protein [Candidatus Woesearchaeota archaeon]
MYKRNYILGLSGDRSLLLDVLQMHGHRIAEVYVTQEAYDPVPGNPSHILRLRYRNPDASKPDTFSDDDARIAAMFNVRFHFLSLGDNLPSSQTHIVLDYRRLPGKKEVLSGLTYALSVFDSSRNSP